MKKKVRKMIVFACMSIIMVNTFCLKASAAEIEVDYEKSANYLDGLKEYISWNNDGVTLSFDDKSAKEAGYSEGAINYVKTNIDNLNLLVQEGYTISEDYTVTVQMVTKNANKMLRASSNVRGVSKVTYGWNVTNIYLNSVDTFVFMMNFYKIVQGEKAILTLCDGVSSFIGCPNLINVCIFLVGMAIDSNYKMACNAASAGNGIIIQQVYYEQNNTTMQFYYPQ